MAQQPYNYSRDRGGYSSRDAGSSQQSGPPTYGNSEKKVAFSADWITNGITDDAIVFAEGFGDHLKNSSFTTSQIRNVFGEIKRIQMAGFDTAKTDFLLLKPKMAYAARRAQDKDKSTGAADFERVMKLAHESVGARTEGDGRRFKNFCDFIEAILAYHKAAGGRD
ncbi:type III-A CRISPR-associated protein Csm2 [Spirosoma koreense]